MAERSLWVDPPPTHPQVARRPAQRPDPEPPPEHEPEEPVALVNRRTAIVVATGLVVAATLMAISGDWFSTGPGVSYLAAWSGAVLSATAVALVVAVVRMLRTDREESLALGIVALVWAGQVAALLTGFGEEALDVGSGAAGAAAGMPAALALALDGLATGRSLRVQRWWLAFGGVLVGTILALALTLLPLGEPQSSITIIR